MRFTCHTALGYLWGALDNNDRLDLRNGFAWRAPLAGVLFVVAWHLLKAGGAFPMLAGLGLAVSGAMLLAPLLAILIASPTGSLFYPRGRATHEPRYSGAIGRRMREHYADAIDEYQSIANEFPNELYPHIGMLEIALNDLQDVERADAIVRRGLQRLKNEADRAQLLRTHRALKQRTLADLEEKRIASAGAAARPDHKLDFLLVTLDAAGNWPPELELIRGLRQRGHSVRVLSDAKHAAAIAGAGAQHVEYGGPPLLHGSERLDETPEEEMTRVLRDVFFNPSYGEALLAEISRARPDAILVDQILMTAAAAAKSTGLPTAMLWHTVYGAIANSPGRMTGAALDPLNAVRSKFGLSAVVDQRRVAEELDAIIAFTLEAFDVAPQDRPPQLHYVGPLTRAQSTAAYSLPWPETDTRPLIVVSYSTSFQNQVATLQRVADAVASLPARVLFTLGHAIRAEELQLPDNAVAQPFVPHAWVLPHASLVVTHAGHGTVMAAVTTGVPLVCTPMGRDQHAVAACVEQRRLGVVASAADSSDMLRRTIHAALNDKGLQRRARAFAAQVDVEAGLRKAIDALEALHPAPTNAAD